ncbi:MAG: hypothetical protein K2X98_02115 [Alphaproteobacteria bacterium]|nr:hypothetical protein [Alphaproteobacteria bacterium]
MSTTKLLSILTAGLLMTGCATEQSPPSSNLGSTYTLPAAAGGKGVYSVMENGKKKMMYESTDLDILSEDVWACCCEDFMPKEGAIVKTNRELEIRVGDYSPNIIIDDVDVSCTNDSSRVEVMFKIKVAHSAGPNANLPMVEVPLFLSAVDIPTQEVYSKANAIARIDLNKPFEIQKVRAFFDISDIKARGLKGWSLLLGIMKSDLNRKFEAEVAKEKEHNIAEAAGRDINKSRTGSIDASLRASEPEAPGLIKK